MLSKMNKELRNKFKKMSIPVHKSLFISRNEIPRNLEPFRTRCYIDCDV